MKYRALTAAGDFQFGNPEAFLKDSPEAVAQAVYTRLRLWAGEWFLDKDEGTDYNNAILGYGAQTTRDIEIRDRIATTPGVLEIEQYASQVNECRQLFVSARVRTAYGRTTLEAQVTP